MKLPHHLILSCLFFVACSSVPRESHDHNPGTVVLVEGKHAHACTDGMNLTIGDILMAYEGVCATKVDVNASKPAPKKFCQKILKGEVRVVENDEPHFSGVEAVGDLVLKPGFILEKTREKWIEMR